MTAIKTQKPNLKVINITQVNTLKKQDENQQIFLKELDLFKDGSVRITCNSDTVLVFDNIQIYKTLFRSILSVVFSETSGYFECLEDAIKEFDVYDDLIDNFISFSR